MLLLRGATKRHQSQKVRFSFQYMLLLRGATSPLASAAALDPVSIHAPLARSNPAIRKLIPNLTFPFQYMLLLRGATTADVERKLAEAVSIHAPLARSNFLCSKSLVFPKFQYMLLLRGATTKSALAQSALTRFNTCSSCEEQLECKTNDAINNVVSIHAPLARSNKLTLV